MNLTMLQSTLLKLVLSLALPLTCTPLFSPAYADEPEGPTDWTPGYTPAVADPYAYTTSPNGPGVWGANRRLVTGPGFGSVSGVFSHTDMSIYKDPSKQIPTTLASGETYSTFIKRHDLYHRNKPTYYFGAHIPNSVVIDSGMQWEEFDQGSPQNPFPRGWAVMMNIRSSVVWPAGDGYICWNWREIATGAMENELGDITMEFSILPDGRVETTVQRPLPYPPITTGMHQAYWPRTSNSRLEAGVPKGIVQNADILRLRRVVGITQGSGPLGFYPDGSYLRGVHFRGGVLRSVTAETNGNLTL